MDKTLPKNHLSSRNEFFPNAIHTIESTTAYERVKSAEKKKKDNLKQSMARNKAVFRQTLGTDDGSLDILDTPSLVQKIKRGEDVSAKVESTIAPLAAKVLPLHVRRIKSLQQLGCIITRFRALMGSELKASAWSSWRELVDAQKQRERYIAVQKESGARAIKVILAGSIIASCRFAYERWISFMIDVTLKEKILAARSLQKAFLRYSGLCRFIRSHQCQTLSNIYLSPPRRVIFHIPLVVRKERREKWIAALRLQSFFRMTKCRRFLRRCMRASVLTQSAFRGKFQWNTFVRARRYAVTVQSVSRMNAARLHFHTSIKACNDIGRISRGYQSRHRFLHCMNVLPTIQCALRQFAARYVAKKMIAQREAEFRAALDVQRCWYIKNDQYSTFVLLCCLRESDRIELEFQEMINSLFRSMKAKFIQRQWQKYFSRSRNSAASKIQRFTLHSLTKERAKRTNRELFAATKIQSQCRYILRKRHSATSKITFFWLKNKKGRFLFHFILLKRIKEQERLEDFRKKILCAILLLQSLARGRLGRGHARLIRVMRSWTAIIKKGMTSARRKMKNISFVKWVSEAFVNITLGACVEFEQIRIHNITETKINVIHTFISEAFDDTITRICNQHVHILEAAARVIQRAYHGLTQKLESKCLKLCREREKSNPFKQMNRIEEIVHCCMSRTQHLYHPDDDRCGISLPLFMRRTGMMYDVFPLLVAKGVVTREHLCNMNEGQLIDIGIEDCHDIIDAANVRRVLIVLSKPTVNIVPKLGKVLLSNGAQDILNRFCIIPPQERQYVIEELFLHAFGAQFCARAKNFAQNKSLLCLPLTRLQLDRYFLRSKTPVKAKELISELLSEFTMPSMKQNIGTRPRHNGEPPYLDETKWDLWRMNECMNYLLFAAERLSTLVRWADLNRVVSACERVLILHGSASWIASEKVLQYLCKMLYTIRPFYDLHTASILIQSTFRGCIARVSFTETRRCNFLESITADYFSSRKDNHVKRVWEEFRGVEEAQYLKRYQEWEEAERRLAIESELENCLRFGWGAQWKQPEGDNKIGQWVYVNGREKECVLSEETSTAKPIYTYKEYTAANEIIRVAQSFIAKRSVWRMARQALRKAKEAKQYNSWKIKHRQRLMQVKSWLMELSTFEDPQNLALRMNWKVILRRSSGYRNGDTSSAAETLLFNFDEEKSVLMIQSQWRALLGRRRFDGFLQSQSLLEVLNQSMKGAGRAAWFGYGLEGMTLEMWLARLGMYEYYQGIFNWHTQQLSKERKDKPRRREKRGERKALIRQLKTPFHLPQGSFQLADFFRYSEDHDWLNTVGIKSIKDRQLIQKTKVSVMGSKSGMPPELQFLNYYKEGDNRSITDCIKESRSLLHGMVQKKFR